MAGRHVEWRKLPNTKFDINRLGDLRRSSDKEEMDKNFTHTFYRGRSKNGIAQDARLELINKIFPEYKR
jgi:hypothetical protein